MLMLERSKRVTFQLRLFECLINFFGGEGVLLLRGVISRVVNYAHAKQLLVTGGGHAGRTGLLYLLLFTSYS